ncbi:MAG TPA: endonuclease/exonuclease/phosphatase family protein, partial [Rhizomicrobium sp.]|nr:endonuclease/exonuclease/phosphatase family protein [Rhizomicrobium sp.]
MIATRDSGAMLSKMPMQNNPVSRPAPRTQAAASRRTLIRVLSWNLLRRTGADLQDVASLIQSRRPDMMLLQEATEEFEDLPRLVGGHLFREPMHGRIYGLAVWSPHPIPRPVPLRLPVSTLPGRVPPRIAQIVQ